MLGPLLLLAVGATAFCIMASAASSPPRVVLTAATNSLSVARR